MKIALSILSMFLLLITVACKNNSQANPVTATGEQSEIIAETEVDYDHDGQMDKLLIRMTSGELKEETEPGPYMGAYWEGEFRLELIANNGTVLHSLDLNTTFGGQSLIFQKHRDFKITFEDYNDDSHPDFSIGQYFSSNGFTYNLYSLVPKGIIVIHHDLFTADSSYSTLYEKVGNTSFKNRYYDRIEGKYTEVLYTWQGEQFVQTECEGCAMAMPSK